MTEVEQLRAGLKALIHDVTVMLDLNIVLANRLNALEAEIAAARNDSKGYKAKTLSQRLDDDYDYLVQRTP